MAGLVAYDSSDEEAGVEEVRPQPAREPLREAEKVAADTRSSREMIPKSEPTLAPAPILAAQTVEDKTPAVYGPQVGLSASGTGFVPLPEQEEEASESTLPNLGPGSPYTANRALLRDLTLPSVPNMDIPLSPPGSPSPASLATDKKFEHFLALKRKGVHFNSRVASNPAMKNPALVDKLLAFADLGGAGGGGEQYRTSLPEHLLPSPDAYPRSAYKEQLRQSQTEIGQARARGKGAPVEFVSTRVAKESSDLETGLPQQS